MGRASGPPHSVGDPVTLRGLGGAHRTLLAWGRLHAPVCTCVQPTHPPCLPTAPFPTQAWPGGPGAWPGMDRPVHVPLQAQLTPPATQAPPPGRWGSFHLQRGLCRSWLGCEGQPGWYSPCAPGWPLPCRSHPLLRQAPLPASPAPSPLLGGWFGGLPRSQAAQMKEGSRGPQLGPPISRDGLGPCGASASPGVERHRTSAGREWTWSPGAAQGPQAPQQPPCFRGCGPSRHRLPPPACSPPSLTAPGEPPHCPLGSGHQIGSGPPWACGAAGLEAAQGSGRGPGGWGLPERTAGCTFGLAPAGACRGCGSGQVLAASQLREDGGGVEVNIRVC